MTNYLCRCEDITQERVEQIIAEGKTTVNDVKRHTRVGMGRCQGGFCTSRCMEQLARELGAPLSAITKRGDGSWLVLDREDVAGGTR